jgi:hypothetical protein
MAMAIDRPLPAPARAGPERPPGRGRLGRAAAVAILIGVAAAGAAHADQLGRLVGAAHEFVRQGPGRGARALEAVAAHIKGLPKTEATVLAAEATPEGHWRFVNRTGETITAGTPAEMKRVVALLVPDAKPEARLALYLTEDSLFARRAALKELPRGSDLNVLIGEESYRIFRRTDGANERLFAEIRAQLVLELTDQKLFGEAVWQLARPLKSANIRIVALEPDGAARLPAAPRLDPVSKKALIDSIDPASLAAALGAVRGQTLLLTGRIDGHLLHFKPASGAERSLIVTDLFAAAERADVNVIVLHASATPRQPGGRNWLWQKVEVQGLEEALERARVADFYNALAAQSRFQVAVKRAGADRTLIEVAPAADLGRAPASRPIGDVLSEAVANLTGRAVIMAGVKANVGSAERQREFDRRLVASVPANLQIGYLALLLIGLLGLPLSRVWWAHIWPPEQRAEYAGSTGYWAARVVRGSVFVGVFLPLSAPLSAPLQLGRRAWETLTMPIRCWRWVLGKRAPRSAERAPGLSAPGAAVAPRGPTVGGGAARSGLGAYRPSR